ncbi:MAG: putative Protein kinase superfamily protein [Streblomastix strix]|uniref:Protein kinase domain-containing protein n=1 Tax=Streblomastix strix TaxID=222440 RepID=A0A5J4WGS1_9EUKA|nr:MAG: putative Protein kinase superfamily protein [Streblomastix strix]
MKNHLEFPSNATGYQLLYEVNHGLSSKVWRAHCILRNLDVSIKIIDLENEIRNFDNVTKEIQVLSLLNHKNIPNILASFVNESSFHSIMQNVFKHGLNEHVIASILKSILQALLYIHNQGQIHRDIKSSSILIDAYGSVSLSNFGIIGLLIGNGKRIQHLHTFIGTPCWMAPEQVNINSGYDFKVDIWAIGITAIELANGFAPHSEETPMKILTMTLKQPPPVLNDNYIDDDESDSDSDSDSDYYSDSDSDIMIYKKQEIMISAVIKQKMTIPSNKINEQNNFDQNTNEEEDGLKHNSWVKFSEQKNIPQYLLSNSRQFSDEFKDFVNQCLQKDPLKRPSASKLLEHKFLKHAKEGNFLSKEILKWIISDRELTKLQHLTQYEQTKQSKSIHHFPLLKHVSNSPQQQHTTSTSNKQGIFELHSIPAFESITVSIDGAESQVDNNYDVELIQLEDSKNLWDFQIDNKMLKHIQEQ